MNQRKITLFYKISTFLIAGLMFVVLLSGCDSSKVDEKTDGVNSALGESVAQEGETTFIYSSEHSDISTSSKTEKSPYVSSLSMLDYDGFTVGDVISILGNDYIVSSELYKDIWGCFYYPDSECPFNFYFTADATTLSDTPDYNFAIVAVSYSNVHTNSDLHISDEVKVNFGFNDYEKAYPEGELIHHETDCAYTYKYIDQSAEISCSWNSENTSGPADFILVDFT